MYGLRGRMAWGSGSTGFRLLGLHRNSGVGSRHKSCLSGLDFRGLGLRA